MKVSSASGAKVLRGIQKISIVEKALPGAAHYKNLTHGPTNAKGGRRRGKRCKVLEELGGPRWKKKALYRRRVSGLLEKI